MLLSKELYVLEDEVDLIFSASPPAEEREELREFFKVDVPENAHESLV